MNMSIGNTPIKLLIFCCSFLLTASISFAEILTPVQDQSQVDSIVNVDVTFDRSSNLYTYSYEVSNGSDAMQDIWAFLVEADTEVSNIQSPAGWSADMYNEKPIISWAATDIGTLPEGYIDDGNLPLPAYAVKPSGTLSGFSFQSPDAPGPVLYYAQGFAKLPTATSEDDFIGAEIPSLLDNSQISTTLGPALDGTVIFTGGRRPAVDGFLGLVGVQDRETFTAPVNFVIRFGVNGETVEPYTFTASLNHVDVTSYFQPISNGQEMVVVFELGGSPLEIGRNVLTTSIDGIVPGTTRTGKDTDSLTFFIQ